MEQLLQTSTSCQPTGFFSTLVAGAIRALLLSQCALVDPSKWPMDRTKELMKNDTNVYDFIVIGAGSAGSVLANRLSEISGWNILLVEAGDDPPADSEIPALAFTMMNTKIDYKYESEPQNHVCHGLSEQRCFYPRGKALGGTSSMNAMLYVRGNKLDYDEWESAGNPGWGYNSILRYFKKSENFDDIATDKQKSRFKYHGKGGELNVGRFNHTHHLHDIVMSAAKQLGHKIEYDINGENQIGFTKLFANVKNGARHSAAAAFLQPAKNRKNLHVIKNAQVLKVLFEDDLASGVLIKMKNGKLKTFNASREIIISAGALNSPKILMLSGIGPENHLKQMGIDVISDLAVGENFQDHIGVLVPFSYPIKDTLPNGYLSKVINEYLMNKKGLLMSGIDSGAFLDTAKDGRGRPDIQLEFVYIDSQLSTGAMHTTTPFNDDMTESFQDFFDDKNMLLVSIILLKPKSRGRIMLRSPDPMASPLIDANFLSDEEDRSTLLRGIEETIKLEKTPTFIKNDIKLDKITYAPCDIFKHKSEQYWKCIIQHTSLAVYHPAGTVKMGPASDARSVVDSRLRIHGIKNLRVIDASIMPEIISGNDNAPVTMIAEKGADMIKQDNL